MTPARIRSRAFDAVPEFGRSLLGEGERDDVVGAAPASTLADRTQQVNDPLRHNLGLTRPRARDELKIARNMADRLGLCISQFLVAHALLPMLLRQHPRLCRRSIDVEMIRVLADRIMTTPERTRRSTALREAHRKFCACV